MPKTPEFHPGLTAQQAHLALKTSIEIRDQAQQCAVLWFSDIMERGLYRDLGFSTMRAYALEMLGFSKTRAGDFIHLARKLKELPDVKNEMVAGRMGYTVAREITSVADAGNQKAWVAETQGKSRREVVAVVKEAKERARQKSQSNPDQGELMPRPAANVPEAVMPVRVTFELTPLQYAQYEKMLTEIGHTNSKAELLLDSVEALAATSKNTPRGVFASRPQAQIHVHHCPSCQEATVATPRGKIRLSAAETAAAHCDAQIHEPGQRNKSAIPPKMRREVLTRDRHRCRHAGCHHTRHLHIHHIVARQNGGTNDRENLVTLCSGCHTHWHDRGGDLRANLTPIQTNSQTGPGEV